MPAFADRHEHHGQHEQAHGTCRKIQEPVVRKMDHRRLLVLEAYGVPGYSAAAVDQQQGRWSGGIRNGSVI